MLLTHLILPLLGNLLIASPPAGSPAPVGRTYDTDTVIEGNNLACFVPNDGRFAYDAFNLRGRADGLYYPNNWPADTRTVIYDAGLWLAGITEEGDTLVTVAEYSAEYRPGAWGSDAAATQWRVYSITQDPATWSDWPSGQGAPLAENGLDPWIAEMPDVTQMLFTVFNDGDPAYHSNDAGSTAPLGAEVRLTSWCSAEPGDEREIRLRWEILNQGDHEFSRLYAAIWMDPDLGGSGDDLVGCDPERALGYCYNATDADEEYGTTPPAVGMVLYSGLHVPSPGDSAWYGNAWHADERNLPTSSFSHYINGTDPHHFRQSLHYMSGLDINGAPRPAGPFDYSGDPVAGTGDLDPLAADKRMMIACGPVTLASGQSQELSVVIAVGQGADRLASLSDLRMVVPYPLGEDEVLLTADPLHFIHVETGASLVMPLVLHNPHLGSWTVDSLACSNPRLQVETEPPFTLPDVSTLELPIRFTADSPGLQRGVIQLFSDDLQLVEAPVSANGAWLEMEPTGNLGLLPPEGFNGDMVLRNVGTDTAIVETITVSEGIWLECQGQDSTIIQPADSLSCPLNISASLSGEHEGVISFQGNMARLQAFAFQWSQPEVQRWLVLYHTVEGRPGPMAGFDWGGRFFGGGVDFGYNFFGSTAPAHWEAPDLYHEIRILFSEQESEWSEAACYRRDLGYAYWGTGLFPGQVWHHPDDGPARRLNVCFVETDVAGDPDFQADGLWYPTTGILGGREYLYIMNSDYNGGADYDGNNYGPAADVLWACWLRLVGGAELREGDIMEFAMDIGSPVEDPGARSRLRALAITDVHPNPFNPTTMLRYRLARPASSVRLEIFNLLGQQVRELDLGPRGKGNHQQAVHGDGLASGLYLLRLGTDDDQAVRRILLLK